MRTLNPYRLQVVLCLPVVLTLAATFYLQSRRTGGVTKSPTLATSSPITGTRANTGTSPLQFSVSTTCCIPVRGRLREQEVASQIVEAQSRSIGSRTPLLNEIIRLAPRYFPPGARVIEAGQVDDEFSINLNRAFSNEKFWRGRTRRDTRLALHALARNIAFINESKGTALPVRFVVEGRGVARIGSFPASRALPPNQIMPISS